MISVSTVKTYMFCPLKLYFQTNIDEKNNEENYLTSKTLKDLRMDLQDLLAKNLRHVKKDMSYDEIEKRLSNGISKQIKITFDILEEVNNSKSKESIETEGNKEDGDDRGIIENKRNIENKRIIENKGIIETEENEETIKKEKIIESLKNKETLRNKEDFIGEKKGISKNKLINPDEIEFIDGKQTNPSKQSKSIMFEDEEEESIRRMEKEKNIEELKKEIINEINLSLKILALKVEQAMRTMDKNGDEIQGLFFPSSMYNYLIRDIGLDMIGVIDKIEVEKGNYFPISLKSSNPPIKGVWDGDYIETIANALLVEQEFDTYINVGYVDYLKINERRPVIIDTDARKSFFKVLTSINRIIKNQEIPNVRTNQKKCERCEYKELCEKS